MIYAGTKVLDVHIIKARLGNVGDLGQVHLHYYHLLTNTVWLLRCSIFLDVDMINNIITLTDRNRYESPNISAGCFCRPNISRVRSGDIFTTPIVTKRSLY